MGNRSIAVEVDNARFVFTDHPFVTVTQLSLKNTEPNSMAA